MFGGYRVFLADEQMKYGRGEAVVVLSRPIASAFKTAAAESFVRSCHHGAYLAGAVGGVVHRHCVAFHVMSGVTGAVEHGHFGNVLGQIDTGAGAMRGVIAPADAAYIAFYLLDETIRRSLRRVYQSEKRHRLRQQT